MSTEATTRVIDPTYGSDQHGLVWAYHFARNQPGQPITSEAVVESLGALDANTRNQFLWLHFSLSNSACERWLHQNLNLPRAFYQSLHANVVPTSRLEQVSNTLVAVIHDVVFDFNFDTSEVATGNLAVQQHLLVSARIRPLRSIDRLRTAVREGHTFRSTAHILGHLLRDQSDVLVEIVRQSTQRVDEIEDRLLAHRRTISRSELGSLRRVLVRLQRLLAPEPAALFRLLNQPPDWITEEDLQDLRRSAEEFSVSIADAAALGERIKLLQEEAGARVMEQTNRSIFVLTIFTVLALPINMVAGLFGMNVGGIPLANHGSGFFLIVGVLAAITGLLVYFTLLRRRD